MSELKDLTGRRFGRLFVVGRAPNKILSSGREMVQWICICDCGTEKKILATNLLSGAVVSCGCLRHEKAVEHGATVNLKHGQNHKGNPTAEYRAWQSMKQRCCNPRATSYKIYGGRGIGVCPEWVDDFERFYADMGRKPSPSHSLDRIDPNGNYGPENCRWADKTTQSRNTRVPRNNTTGVKGVQRVSTGGFVATIGLNGKSVYLGHYVSVTDAKSVRVLAEKLFWGM